MPTDSDEQMIKFSLAGYFCLQSASTTDASGALWLRQRVWCARGCCFQGTQTQFVEGLPFESQVGHVRPWSPGKGLK